MKIKELRQITGLSQKKFSEKFKIPVRTIQNWESGTNPTPIYTEKLIEMQLILENEIEDLRAGQLRLTSSEPEEQPEPEPEPQQKQQPQNTDTVRKEIFRTIDEYMESDDIVLSCQDCKYDRKSCDDYECDWKNYKYYKEYKKIIEEELNK